MLKNVYSMPSKGYRAYENQESSAFELILLTNEPKFKEFSFLRITNAKIIGTLNVESMKCLTLLNELDEMMAEKKQKWREQTVFSSLNSQLSTVYVSILFLQTNMWIVNHCVDTTCYYCIVRLLVAQRFEQFLYHWMLSAELVLNCFLVSLVSFHSFSFLFCFFLVWLFILPLLIFNWTETKLVCIIVNTKSNGIVLDAINWKENAHSNSNNNNMYRIYSWCGSSVFSLSNHTSNHTRWLHVVTPSSVRLLITRHDSFIRFNDDYILRHCCRYGCY